MPIRFRCSHCQGLMAISSRQAGATVECSKCGKPTQVPPDDEFDLNVSREVTRFELEAVSEPSHSDDSQTMSDNEIAENLEGNWETTGVEEPSAHHTMESTEKSGEESDVEEAQEEDVSAEKPFAPEEIGGDDDHGEEPLSFRRHKNLDDEMDLTPMVDVTFQLLIFFMVSASFSLQKSIEVPTQDPDQKGASQQVQTLDDLQGTSIIVKIDASNTILIDDEPIADVLRLADTLRDKMRREQKTELLVTADNQSLHRTIIAVIDAANEVGMQKIRMTSRKKAD